MSAHKRAIFPTPILQQQILEFKLTYENSFAPTRDLWHKLTKESITKILKEALQTLVRSNLPSPDAKYCIDKYSGSSAIIGFAIQPKFNLSKGDTSEYQINGNTFTRQYFELNIEVNISHKTEMTFDYFYNYIESSLSTYNCERLMPENINDEISMITANIDIDDEIEMPGTRASSPFQGASTNI